MLANKTLFKEARPGQLRNYNKLFKDRDVIDTVIEAIISTNQINWMRSEVYK